MVNQASVLCNHSMHRKIHPVDNVREHIVIVVLKCPHAVTLYSMTEYAISENE